MAQICLEVSGELLERLNQNGYNPNEFFQARLVELSTSIDAVSGNAKLSIQLRPRKISLRELFQPSWISNLFCTTTYRSGTSGRDGDGLVRVGSSEWISMLR